MTATAELRMLHAEPLPLVGESLQWLNADAVPALQDARREAMLEGRQILESRSQLLREGAFEQVPYAVDPLTTAGRAVALEKSFGPKHPTTRQAKESTVVDSRRLLGEASRKLSWEYYPELEQTYDEETEDYYYLGRSLTDMVNQGITPIAEHEQTLGRLDEKVEETTYGAIRRLGKLALDNVVIMRPAAPGMQDQVTAHPNENLDVRVITVSECDDWAIEAYKTGTETNFGGLVPEIEKFMIRGVRFGSEIDSRYQEGLALSGKHISHEDIAEAMQELRVIPAGTAPTKKEVRATQMINANGQGVIAFAELLDEIAGRRTGLRIFMGEIIPENQPKDYAGVAELAAQREKDLSRQAEDLAEYLFDLERRGVDHWAANGLVEAFVKKQLYGKVRNDPEQAAIIFGEQTARGIESVMQLRQRGEMEAAMILERQVSEAAPPPAFCGAGSCGLEAVKQDSVEEAAGRSLGLKGELLSFKKGKCPNPDCGKGTLVFDTKGNKGCTACGSSEIAGHAYGAVAQKRSFGSAIFAAAQKPAKKQPAALQKV